MDYSVSFSFILLSTHPEKGYFLNSGTSFNYGLIGAIIMDMTAAGLLETKDHKLYVKNSETEDPLAVKIIHEIQTKKKARKIKYWITKLGGHSVKYKKILIHQMQEQEIIQIVRKKFLGLIPYKRYKILMLDKRKLLINRLYDDLIHDKKLSEKESTMLGLIKATNIQRILYVEGANKKEVRKKLRKRVKEDALSMDVSRSIQEVQAAIAAASTSGAVVASAGGN